MHLLFLFLIFNFSNIDNQWVTYFDNKKIKISYKDTLCDDVQNGFSFYYYLIKIENKTNETFVINFFLGEEMDKKEENKVAFVLNPYETRSGTCSYDSTQLKLFKSENKTNKSYPSKTFSLNNINTIEVY
jgi:hypothetical protein